MLAAGVVFPFVVVLTLRFAESHVDSSIQRNEVAIRAKKRRSISMILRDEAQNLTY